MAAIGQHTKHIGFFIICETHRAAAAESGGGEVVTAELGLGIKKLREAPESGVIEAYSGGGDDNGVLVGAGGCHKVVRRKCSEASHAGDAVGSECHHYNQHNKTYEHFHTSRGVHILLIWPGLIACYLPHFGNLNI